MRLESTIDTVAILDNTGCALNVSVGRCVATSSPWADVNGVDVAYIKAIHAIQIGRGATRMPEFSSRWPKPMQLVTLGYKLAVAYASAVEGVAADTVKTCMFPASADRDDLFAAYIAMSAIMDGIYTEPPDHRNTLLTIWAQAQCQGDAITDAYLSRLTNGTMSRLTTYYSTFNCPVDPILQGSNKCISSH